MDEIGKMLIILGVGIGIVGIVILLFGRVSDMGRLPGDIVIQTENFSCIFPLLTSIIVSIVLTLLLNLVLYALRR